MAAPTFREKWVHFIIHRPWLALAAGIILMLALGSGGKSLAPDFSFRVWFTQHDPLIKEFDAFERRFGNDDRSVVIVHSPSGVFDKETVTLLNELTEAMWRVPNVIRVDSLANFNWVHAEEEDLLVEPLLPDDEELTPEFLAARKKIALAHETLPNYLVNKDATVALLFATVKPAIGGSPDYESFLNGAEGPDGKRLEGVRNLAKRFSTGDHSIMTTGGPEISQSFKEAADVDIKGILPWVLALTFVLLFVLFRRLSGIFVPLTVIIASIMASMGVGGWFGCSINNMTAMVPQVLIAIVVADVVHILVSFYRPYDQGMDKLEALRYALDKNYVPTLLTSASTAIGFFSFSQAQIVPIAQLGIMAGIGTLLAWLFTYLIAGPLVRLCPIKQKQKSANADYVSKSSPFSDRAALWLENNRRWVLGISAVALLATFGVASKTKVNSDPYMYFPKDHQMNIATTFLEDKLGGATTIEIVLDSGKEDGFKNPAFLAKVNQFQDWLDTQSYVTSNTSIVDILKSMNRSLNGDKKEAYVLPDTREGIAQQFLLYTMSVPQGMDVNDRVTVKSDAIRMTSAWDIHDSATVINAIDAVEAKAADLGLNAHITGKAQLWQRMNPYVVNTFVVSITVAIVVMSLLMIVVFRSVYLGSLAMLPNLLPLILGAALLVLIGQNLDMGAVIAFSFCLGIAVDDTVHFMANYARLTREGKSPRESVAHIFTHTVPALLTTTIILVVAFGAFIFASFLPNRNFGLFVSVILSMALIADVTLLPALLMTKQEPEKTSEPDVSTTPEQIPA